MRRMWNARGSMEQEDPMLGNSAVRPRARICLALAAIFSAPVAARAPLSVRVSPHIATEPATLVLQIVVEPNTENRGMQISIDSEDYSRRSFVQLDGDEAPRVTSMELSSVPGGAYEVKATLFGPGSKERATASSFVEVMSRAGGR